jgi:hypothetical protein
MVRSLVSLKRKERVMAGSEVELKPERRLTGPALFAAFLALLLWAIFVMVMVWRADTASDLMWTRLAFLFASVEAVAFAAGGALWGASIQRERAEKAEAKAAANQQEATSGRALATMLIAEGEQAEQASGGLQRLGAEAGGADVAQRHARAARSLFPHI